jgi:hypothetical protein
MAFLSCHVVVTGQMRWGGWRRPRGERWVREISTGKETCETAHYCTAYIARIASSQGNEAMRNFHFQNLEQNQSIKRPARFL